MAISLERISKVYEIMTIDISSWSLMLEQSIVTTASHNKYFVIKRFLKERKVVLVFERR